MVFSKIICIFAVCWSAAPRWRSNNLKVSFIYIIMYWDRKKEKTINLKVKLT